MTPGSLVSAATIVLLLAMSLWADHRLPRRKQFVIPMGLGGHYSRPVSRRAILWLLPAIATLLLLSLPYLILRKLAQDGMPDHLVHSQGAIAIQLLFGLGFVLAHALQLWRAFNSR